MVQAIKNIKAGQKFTIVEMSCGGFDIGCIVEALDDIENVTRQAGNFKWIGGYKPTYVEYSIINNKEIILIQNVEDLKRFKGKIK